MTHPPEPLFDAAIRVLHSYLWNHGIDDCYANRICATISTLAAERDAALANARTPGTVEVCRMLSCECKHEYQWDDCEAANCPIRAAKALSAAKVTPCGD